MLRIDQQGTSENKLFGPDFNLSLQCFVFIDTETYPKLVFIKMVIRYMLHYEILDQYWKSVLKLLFL